jgi:hypothetical protein
MNELEQWVNGWLSCPVKALNVSYWRTRKPFPELVRDVMAPKLSISDDILLQLHQRIKGRRAEWRIWDVVIDNISHPLPDSITNDLIDRDICISQLAHSIQNENILKRLVPLVDEALLTYAKSTYYDAKYSVDDFAEIIAEYPTHNWLFDSLAHSTPSSPEKREVFLVRVREHPDRERLLATEEAMHDTHERYAKAELEREQLLETALNTKDEQKIREILKAGETELLFCLLKNPNTPDDVLVSITQLRNFTNAGVLRGQAKNVLDNRENCN